MWASPVGGIELCLECRNQTGAPWSGLVGREKGILGGALGNSRISSFGELGADSTEDGGSETSAGSGFLPRLAHSIRGLSYRLIWSWSLSRTFFFFLTQLHTQFWICSLY